jgi:sugar/nucleoside kinase (ribokinase family)
MKKVLGIGNALTDILLQIEQDEILVKLNLPKGSMQLVDENKLAEINQIVGNYPKKMAAGGSAANTINGITRLGASAGLIGKLGKDEIGDFFTHDSNANGVTPLFLQSETPSGCCTVLVSPDGERTMCTFLGAACELTADDLTLEMFKGYDIFHIEGYLVFNQDLILKAVQLAKEAGLKVSIDLASYNVVDAKLDFLKELVSQYVDIVFANEEEARSFTGKEPEEALKLIAALCEIAVVKIGKEGSYIQSGDETVKIDARRANCIDTTGAGDLYASGFLFGLAAEYSLEQCGRMGALVAGNVVEVLGAKMTNEVWNDIHLEMKEIVK